MNVSGNQMSTPRLLVAAAFGLGLLAGCGSDDDAASGTGAVTTESTEPAGLTVEEPAEVTEAPTSTSAASTGSTVFPVTIEHKFGETTIDAEPERVVSIGFSEHDGLLALGVTPIAVRDWYGDQPYATWPWAQDELGDAQPEVLSADALNFEQIAALRPDVILGVGSGMTDSEYATLSEIAPTVAQSGDYADYGMPWAERLRMDAAAVGRSDEAEQIIAVTEAKFAAVRDEHPEFDGRAATVAFVFDGQPGAYAADDVRPEMLSDLGFTTPPKFDELAGDNFFFSISPEELEMLDTDVLIWIAGDDLSRDAIVDLPLRTSLTAFREGREIFADDLLSAAFSHASPLSFDYVLDELVPELALAVDGDPATAVPSAAALEGEASESLDSSDDATGGGTTDSLGSPEADAAAEAWATVFDSTIDFETKAPHIDGADALADTIAGYTDAGSAMGGISLQPTAVVVDDGSAEVTYDVYFGENPAYTDLTGAINLVDGVWVVGRDEFCAFMASARNACPAEESTEGS